MNLKKGKDKLTERHYTESSARWAVETWAFALKGITVDMPESPQQKNKPAPEPVDQRMSQIPTGLSEVENGINYPGIICAMIGLFSATITLLLWFIVNGVSIYLILLIIISLGFIVASIVEYRKKADITIGIVSGLAILALLINVLFYFFL